MLRSCYAKAIAVMLCESAFLFVIFWSNHKATDRAVHITWVSPLPDVSLEGERLEMKEYEYHTIQATTGKSSPSTTSVSDLTTGFVPGIPSESLPSLDLYVNRHREDYFIRNNVLLHIHFNSVHYERVPYLELMYSSVFPKIVYTVPVLNATFHSNNPTGSPVIECPWGYNGIEAYYCAHLVISAFPDYSGYLHVHFDVLVNYWNLKKRDLTRFWHPPVSEYNELSYSRPRCRIGWDNVTVCEPANWNHWFEVRDSLERAWYKLPRRYRKKYAQNTRQELGDNIRMYIVFSDIIYVPERYKNQFSEVASVMHEEGVHLEVGWILLINCIETEPSDLLKSVILWGGDRWNWKRSYDGGSDFLHPFPWHEGDATSFLVNRWHP
jgi:hypothetical protein